VDRRGVAVELRSRTDEDPTLKGTKHLVASQRRLQVARGRSDGRTVLIIPEVKDHCTVGLTLLHVRFCDRLTASELRGVLGGYGNRYQALADAVTETEPAFDEARLATLPVTDLLCAPVESLADHWRDGASPAK
jgi:glucosamine--fructose-6-phosphate aminotransferase (isomerizing)